MDNYYQKIVKKKDNFLKRLSHNNYKIVNTCPVCGKAMSLKTKKGIEASPFSYSVYHMDCVCYSCFLDDFVKSKNGFVKIMGNSVFYYDDKSSVNYPHLLH